MNTEALKALARPIGMVLCILTLCILAIAQFAQTGSVPAWNYSPIIAIAGEWFIERAITKRKETKNNEAKE